MDEKYASTLNEVSVLREECSSLRNDLRRAMLVVTAAQKLKRDGDACGFLDALDIFEEDEPISSHVGPQVPDVIRNPPKAGPVLRENLRRKR